MGKSVNTACYIVNRVSLRSIIKRTPYELYKHKKPSVKHFHPFGCKCFILNNGKDQLGKFDAKSDEGIFLGYSSQRKAYRIFNERTLIIEESIHVVFDDKYVQKQIEDDHEENPIDMKKLSLNEGEIQAQEKEQREPSYPR